MSFNDVVNLLASITSFQGYKISFKKLVDDEGFEITWADDSYRDKGTCSGYIGLLKVGESSWLGANGKMTDRDDIVEYIFETISNTDTRWDGEFEE